MYRFFAEKQNIGNDAIRIEGSDVNHIRNVLRMHEGEQLFISDQKSKEYICVIDRFETDAVIARIISVQNSTMELTSRIYLFQGLPKAGKMDVVIQKAVELGVCGIIPVSMKRSVIKLDEKKKRVRREHWQGVAHSAAKQSKRTCIPDVYDVMTFQEALEFTHTLDVVLVPYEECHSMRETRETLSGIRRGQSIGIFIGPEGGFDPEEIAQAAQIGASMITLGRRILRTETAGMTILSILMFQLERE